MSPTKYEMRLTQYTVGQLKKQVDKLNRRAKNLGMDRIIMGVGPFEAKELTFEDPHNPGSHITINTQVATVTIQGVPPRIDGWDVVAIANQELSTGIVTWSAVASDVDIDSLDANHTCDHCQMRRTRRRVFYVRNGEGEIKRVGSSCVESFTGGRSPQQFAWAAQARWIRHMLLDSPEVQAQMEWSTHSDQLHSLREILALAVLRVEIDGEWRSKSAHGDDATASNLFHLGMKSFLESRHFEEVDRIISIVANEEAGDSAYMASLQSVCRSTHITDRHIGLAVSAIGVAKRIAAKAQQEQLPSVNEWFGSTGQRLTIVVLVEGIKEIFGAYGDSTLYKFRTAEGHQLAWFCSGRRIKVESGDKVTITGTIKDHNDFRGSRQTMLTRVRLA